MATRYKTKGKKKRQPSLQDRKFTRSQSQRLGSNRLHPATPLFGLPSWSSQAALSIIVLFFALIRLRLLSYPLERDEGEYAYAGQLIRQGIAPFRFCYSMKLPGTAAVYALVNSIFGQTTQGVHLGLLLVNSTTTLLVFFLTRRLFGAVAGVVASATFAFLSIEPTVLGFAGHATHFVMLPAIGGILLLLRAMETNKRALFFACGVVLGLAFLMKQPGLFFILFAVFYLAYVEWTRGLQWREFPGRVMLLSAGAALPFALTCLVMFKSGVFSRFWFWTFVYASKYGSIVSFSQGLQIFLEMFTTVVTPALLLWILAAMGMVGVIWNSKSRTNTVFVWSFFAFSFAAVCPGLFFRPHYFILLLPAVSMLAGAAVSGFTSLIRESRLPRSLILLPWAFFAVAFAAGLSHDREFLFQLDPVAACRLTCHPNPFLEAPKIAEYIAQHSAEGDRVAVVGSEPEIYFYSGRRSATGYVYTYPLMEDQPFAKDMQREMETEIENTAPRFLVFVNVSLSWLANPRSDMGIFTWAEQYARSHYQLVGIIDLLDDGTEFHWGADARSYSPRSQERVLVLQRF